MQATTTETFEEIWAGMTEEQHYSLYTALLHEKCTTTRQTVWNWGNGKARPRYPDVITHIARVTSKVVGKRVIPDALFPKK